MATHLSALRQLYARVDALYAPYSCERCGACCALHETGLVPWLFPIERELLALAAEGLDRAAPPTCPHLDATGACRVYAARPFGCRTWYCGRLRAPPGVRRRGPPHEAIVALTVELAALAEGHAPGEDPRPLL